jgi:hypothetical protein
MLVFWQSNTAKTCPLNRWTLPEVRECLEEAGFDSVHFWLRDMHALDNAKDNEEIWENISKYEETTSFHQQSAWNAYVVGVARQKHLSS